MTTPPPHTPSDGKNPSYAQEPNAPKRSKKPWTFSGIGVVVVIFVIAAVAGCGSGDKATTASTSSSAAPSTVTVTAAPTTSQAPAPAVPAPAEVSTPAAAAPTAEAAVMPAVVCMNLQAAQDLIQEKGVFFSRSDDATGQGRRQLIDRNWIVVSQTPAAGEPVTEAEAVLSVVKDDEPNNC